jgi:GT2 family glycosyltransferase
MEKIAVIIVNWNKIDYLDRLMKGLSTIERPFIDITVVDNASTDGSIEFIKEHYPEINLIENRENLGGTGGFNTGLNYVIEKSNYSYAWLLDNDAEVEIDTLEKLYNVITSDRNIAICGSKIVDPEDRKTIVETGAVISWAGATTVAQNKGKCKENVTGIIDVDYVAVCSALVNMEAVKKVGVMDEQFFLLWDDIEWGWRFKKEGYRVCVSCDSTVYHPDFSNQRDSCLKRYYSSRNALYFFKSAEKGKYFKKSLKRTNSIKSFFKITGEVSQGEAAERGIKDFNEGKRGRVTGNFSGNKYKWKEFKDFSLDKNKSVLLIPESYRHTQALIENYPFIKWLILTEDFRKSQYEHLSAELFTFKDNIKDMVHICSTVRKKKPDIVLIYKSIFPVIAAILNSDNPLILYRNNVYYKKNRDPLILIKLGFLKIYNLITG